MNLVETPLGFEMHAANVLFFFGKREADGDSLARGYSHAWARLRQTHSDIVLHSEKINDSPYPEGDAHWTRSKNLGLLISTADCAPVLLADPVAGLVAAAHSGWKGVASRIVPKTVKKILTEGARAERLIAVIGPHIQRDSFEVDDDVRDLLLKASSADRDLVADEKPGRRTRVDLNAIIKTQLAEFDVLSERLFDLHLDTMTDLRFHSYRRDREAAGRQLSFVIRR